jgi:DEAD/DEAH box helicase domain-containing protein
VANSAQEIYGEVLGGLVENGLLFERQARTARVWGLDMGAFHVTTDVVQFRCKYCSFAISVGEAEAAFFEGNHCMRYGCDGHFEQRPSSEDYYRRLYESGDVKRIFSAEHTGLLERATRERIEDGFRDNNLPGDPNLLSCTPTLEMGINIGAVDEAEDAVAMRNAETGERSLLYVALTRARRSATITSYGSMSPFLSKAL